MICNRWHINHCSRSYKFEKQKPNNKDITIRLKLNATYIENGLMMCKVGPITIFRITICDKCNKFVIMKAWTIFYFITSNVLNKILMHNIVDIGEEIHTCWNLQWSKSFFKTYDHISKNCWWYSMNVLYLMMLCLGKKSKWTTSPIHH